MQESENIQFQVKLFSKNVPDTKSIPETYIPPS